MKKRIKTHTLVFTAVALLLSITLVGRGGNQPTDPAQEAVAGFDNETNGFVDPASHASDLEVFEEVDEIQKGLGPVYNAQSCRECHQNPRTGGTSQITELRAGHFDHKGNFVDAPGGSLINDRSIEASLQESVPESETVRTFRTSLNTFGDGYVEAIDDSFLLSLPAQQAKETHGLISGQVIKVPVVEKPGLFRVGRFGWKDQHASLLSFAGDAYLNEIGITSPLFLTENTSMGRSVQFLNDLNGVPAVQDPADPDTGLADIDFQARFMRATKVPPRLDLSSDPKAFADAQAGQQIFNEIGCNICHVSTIKTATPTKLMQSNWIKGLTADQAAVLGNKIIHPFSDFLLHDVGSGDGIVQNGGQSTAYKLRTPPLWGLHTHDRFMHDGASTSLLDAIGRHSGEAYRVVRDFNSLRPAEQRRLLAFLKSL